MPRFDFNAVNAGLAASGIVADFETALIRNRKRVLREAVSTSDFKAAALARMNALREANAAAARDCFAELRRRTEAQLRRAYSAGVRNAESRLAHMPVVPRRESRLLSKTVIGVATSLAGIVATAQQSANRQFQRIIAQVDENTSDLTEEVDRVNSYYLRKNVTGSVNKRGAEMPASSAAEMTVRSESIALTRAAQGERAGEYGFSLVLINAVPGACELCTPWETKILIDDITAGGKPDGEHALLSEAVADGLFHINCRHDKVVFIPGLTNPKMFDYDKATPEYNAKRYYVEQEQRYNERMIRQWKREAEGVLSAEREDYALKKVTYWQERQRMLEDYAERKGVPFYRQYEREQIGGNTAPKVHSIHIQQQNNATQTRIFVYNIKDLENEVRAHELRIANKEVEHVVVFAKSGKAYENTGTHKEVSLDGIPDAELIGAVVTHNHPLLSKYPQSFSKADVGFTVDSKVAELRVITDGNLEFRFRYSGDLTGAQLADEYKRLFDKFKNLAGEPAHATMLALRREIKGAFYEWWRI